MALGSPCRPAVCAGLRVRRGRRAGAVRAGPVSSCGVASCSPPPRAAAGGHCGPGSRLEAPPAPASHGPPARAPRQQRRPRAPRLPRGFFPLRLPTAPPVLWSCPEHLAGPCGGWGGPCTHPCRAPQPRQPLFHAPPAGHPGKGNHRPAARWSDSRPGAGVPACERGARSRWRDAGNAPQRRRAQSRQRPLFA